MPTYKAFPTVQQFHADYKKYHTRFLAGPPSSGKSVGSMMELMAVAFRQEPTPDGVRPTKFGVFRSTYGELSRTTLETMKVWLPSKYTKINHAKPILVNSRIPLPDGTIADITFELIAIESLADLSKLDSYECTAVWLNEVSGLPKALVGRAFERTGRYPPRALWPDGENHCTWRGLIGDYNYPPRDHWLVDYLHECDELPAGTMLYEQPPALLEHVDPDTGVTTYDINPEAENLVSLDGGQKYMDDLALYQSLGLHDMIQTRLLCRYGRAGGDGKRVFTNFDRDYHVPQERIQPAGITDVLLSVDTSGIHPCALFWQCVRGVWRVTDGVYGEEMGLEEFIDDVLTPMLTMRYPECDVLAVCDPANARDSRTATSPTALLLDRGIPAQTAVTNKFKDRLQAAEMLLSRRDKGAVSVSPHLTMLVAALDGAYQYRQLRTVGSDVIFSSEPLKNRYSHWADAFQYGALHIVSSTVPREVMDRAKRIAAASFRRGRA